MFFFCYKGWEHYATKDFIHYQELGMPLFPDHERDRNGAYSGSAFVENNKIHYFYTGNVKEIGDYDYILKGRRILIGWMGLPDVDYTIPTVENNWQHALTMPRILHFKEGRLYQEPLPEFKELRLEKKLFNKPQLELENNVFELHISKIQDQLSLKLRNDFTLEYENGLLTITMHEAGYGRKQRHLEIEHLEDIVIFSECRSLECNQEVELYYLDSFKITYEK